MARFATLLLLRSSSPLNYPGEQETAQIFNGRVKALKIRAFIWRLSRLLRASAFFVIAFVMGLFVLGDVLAVLAQSNGIETEHRLTSLETTVAGLVEDMRDIRHYFWVGGVGMAGLCGEAGLRLARRKNGNGNGNGAEG